MVLKPSGSPQRRSLSANQAKPSLVDLDIVGVVKSVTAKVVAEPVGMPGRPPTMKSIVTMAASEVTPTKIDLPANIQRRSARSRVQIIKRAMARVTINIKKTASIIA